MIERPKLLNGQYAVLAADGATGHVLTTEGELDIGDGKAIFLFFMELNSAKEHIAKNQLDNPTREFVIYDSNYETVEFYKAPEWNQD